MKDKIVCVRVNSDLYNESKKILDSFGITMSIRVNMFLKKVCQKKGIPFELTYDDYNDETKEAIKEGFMIAEEEEGYSSMEDFINELEKEDEI